jgi:hypothetical protein
MTTKSSENLVSHANRSAAIPNLARAKKIVSAERRATAATIANAKVPNLALAVIRAVVAVHAIVEMDLGAARRTNAKEYVHVETIAGVVPTASAKEWMIAKETVALKIRNQFPIAYAVIGANVK